MRHLYFLLRPKVVFLLALGSAAIFAYETQRMSYAIVFLYGMFFGIFYMMRVYEEAWKKTMFKLTYVCNNCHNVFDIMSDGRKYQTASMCTCGNAAPLIGVECITTLSSEPYKNETK